MDESQRQEFGELYDRLAAIFGAEQKIAKREAYEALKALAWPAVKAALRELTQSRKRREGMPTPGDILEVANRAGNGARFDYFKQKVSDHERLDEKAVGGIVGLLKACYETGWHPNTADERSAAWMFHQLLHFSDRSLPEQHRPPCPPLNSDTTETLNTFGGINALAELTPETVLEARRMFCQCLVDLPVPS